jgi:hypothetical protein
MHTFQFSRSRSQALALSLTHTHTNEHNVHCTSNLGFRCLAWGTLGASK